MKTIYDHELYAALEKNFSWETFCQFDEYRKPFIPPFAGGLDRIHRTKKFFEFHDIGCNGRDNSFRIGEYDVRKTKKKE